jgi:FAD/FMN-containing dehydrogenase
MGAAEAAGVAARTARAVALRIESFCEAVMRSTRATTLESGDACARFEHDALYGGAAACVLLPATRDDVGEIVRLAHEHRVTLVAQGARTGLVGAAVPDATRTQCVLSLEKLDRVIAFDRANRSVTAEAGMRLSALEGFLADHDLQFPIDIGSDPTLGGLVATNAGGSRLVRYGDVRRNVLGLEAVLADRYGTRIDALAPLRKNNTGIDLKQLFIGAGGALGVVTAVSLELRARERSSSAFFVALSSYEAAAQTLLAFEDTFGDLLCAFEFLAAETLAATLEAFPDLRAPLPLDSGRCFALVEVATAMGGLDAFLLEKSADLLEHLSRAGLVRNAAMDAATHFWRVRDAVPLALAKLGLPLSFDVAFSRVGLVPFLAEVREWLGHAHPLLSAHVFGHFGDGGAHLVLLVPDGARESYTPVKTALLRSEVYRIVCRHGGSFSAEHGIGPANFAYYRKLMPASLRRVTAQLQAALDPERVLGRCRYEESQPTLHATQPDR